jgi:branched-chain amino acid transport system substrate-binding protein
MNRRSVYIFGTLLVLLAPVVAEISCNSQSGKISDAVSSKPQGDPIKIGVCMPSSGPLAELATLQADGVRAAFQMEGAAEGRPVELIFSDPGSSGQGFGSALEGLIGRDHVSAIIACIPAEVAVAHQGILKDRAVSFIVTSPVTFGWKSKGDEPFVRICTTLEDQAQASARFAANTLRARRLGVILDLEDATCVRLTSLFSANIVRQGGSIVDVAYVKKNEDPSPALIHLMGEKTDIVYVPFSSLTSVAMIIKARAIDKELPIIVSNVQPEEVFLSGAERSLAGVYVLTDFHEQAVISVLGKKFIEFYHKGMKKKAEIGPSIAMGADAYFLAINMILRGQHGGGQGYIPTGAQWNGSILGLSGVGPSGAVRSQLSVGFIKKGFLRDATLKFIGMVEVKGLDPGTDVRAQ